MNYLGEDEVTQMMGFGYYGEVRPGPDGNLYQWVEGYDGLGNPIGFWKKLRRRIRAVARRALPLAQRFAPFVPGVGPAVAAGLRTATPYLRQAGVLGTDGLGALYQAPDGTLYQVQGLAEDEELRGFAEDEELRGFGEDEVTQMMGFGYYGEVRPGPDGNLYQWVEGYDGLGNPIGFWKKLRRRIRAVARRALPLAQRFAPFVPGVGPAVAAGLRTATPYLRQAGVLGYDGLAEDEELRGLGALYQAPDGTLYQMQGLAEDEELRGFAEDEELRGFAEDEELRGFAEDEELRGFAEDEELRGLYGYDGFVREDGVNGLDAFVPEQAAQTRWFTPPSQPPEMWRPLW